MARISFAGGGAAEAADDVVGLYSDYIHIRDEKAKGTDGGTFTQDAWQTRDLTDELDDTGTDASLASNQITLEAGTYRCLISCPALGVDAHKARLYNVTDESTILIGTAEYTDNALALATRSFVVGRFTLEAQKVLEVQHYCRTTKVGNGFGAGHDMDVIEVFTEVELLKEA